MTHSIFPILPPTRVAALLMSLIVFITACNPPVKTANNFLPNTQPDSICKNVAATTFSNAQLQNNDSTFLEVYALKKSADMGKRDFDLAVFLRNAAGNFLDSTWQGTAQQFQDGETNYFKFLKNRNIPADEVATGYIITLNPARLKEQNDVHLCISIPDGNVKYYYSNTQASVAPADSACCKCPPRCSFITQSYKSGPTEAVKTMVYSQ